MKSGAAITDIAPKPKVVLVDDDPMILGALKVVLQKKYDVQCCTSAPLGVEAAMKFGVAVVVLDVKMPEFDGFWAFRQIRAAGGTMPIVFNSAYQDMVLPDELKSFYKPFAYLSKSGQAKEFQATVEAAVKAFHEGLQVDTHTL